MRPCGGSVSPEHFVRLCRQIQVKPGQPTVIAATDHVIAWQQETQQLQIYNHQTRCCTDSHRRFDNHSPTAWEREANLHANPEAGLEVRPCDNGAALKHNL